MYFQPEAQQTYTLHSQIRSAFPSMSLPPELTGAMLAELGVYPVSPADPGHDPITHAARGLTPALIDGQYVQQWEIYPLDAETVAANQVAEAQRVRSEIMDGVQRYLDDFARTKTYDSILSACTYATSTVPRFASEGQYCVQSRDACWDAVAIIEAEVMAGTRPVPAGFEDIRAELPTLIWPPVDNQTP